MMKTNLDYRAMGERVLMRRRHLGLTQGELAREVGVSASFIGHIERGEKKASAETILALSECLGVAADYLLRGRENRCDRQRCSLYADLLSLLGRYGDLREKGPSQNANEDGAMNQM